MTEKKEYIEKKTALELVEFYRAQDYDNFGNFNVLLSRMGGIEPSDVIEVVHAMWIDDGNGVQICSNCGEEHEWMDYRATYCEDCGAKMDGKPVNIHFNA